MNEWVLYLNDSRYMWNGALLDLLVHFLCRMGRSWKRMMPRRQQSHFTPLILYNETAVWRTKFGVLHRDDEGITVFFSFCILVDACRDWSQWGYVPTNQLYAIPSEQLFFAANSALISPYYLVVLPAHFYQRLVDINDSIWKVSTKLWQ